MVVKERVEGDLDYIIDRLIERDVFTIQTKVSQLLSFFFFFLAIVQKDLYSL